MFSYLLLAVWLVTICGYPYKLPCNREMTPGSIIMGNPAKIYDLRSVQVLRNGHILDSDDTFVPGETLTVQVSTISTTTGSFKFMFQASGGALFQTGNVLCNGLREYNVGDGTLGATQLRMPTTPNTQVNIWVAWATQFGHVYISNNFTLTNFPSTRKPSLSPAYKSTSPTFNPTKVPTVKAPTVDTNPKLHFANETQQNFTLVLKKQVLPNHFGRSMITVNDTVPGPTLRVKVGQWVNVKVINEIGSEMSVLHWHGFDQKSTPWNDGPPGVTQCLINTMNGTKFLSSDNTVTQLNYKFFADRAGTFWYHGHYNSQYPEGIYGAIVVEDDDVTTDAYAALGATYSQDTEIMIADFYQTDTKTLLDKYLLPSSSGLEPIPDYIVVNNMFTKSMQISVKHDEKIRLRVINSAALSMYDVSVDGCPLKVIEVDGSPVKPQLFSTVRLDVGQRVSFILDWETCDSKVEDAANIPLKVKAVKGMYRQYDQTDTTHFGLLGSTTKAKYLLTWVGQFVFSSGANQPLSYYYYGSSIPVVSNAPVPVEPNLLEMTPLFNKPVPPLDLVMDYNMTFSTDATGVFKFFINGAAFANVNNTDTSPKLFDYMMPNGGPLTEVNLPKYSKITGDGVNPFVLPYNRSITMIIRNGDGQSHPIHTHGHNFWVIATSQYTPKTPIMRDTISVPGQGWAKIRFISDNPGVWLLHCHIDWHMYNGFMATMIEAPSMIKNTISNLPPDHKSACPQYFAPTSTPTYLPSVAPMSGSWSPTLKPSKAPTTVPTTSPSYAPVKQFESSDPYAMDWKTYGYDNMRRGYNPTETKIKSTTVNKLTRVWKYQLAGGAYMQPVIVLNYDFGNFPNTQFARRKIDTKQMLRTLDEDTSSAPSVEPTVAVTTSAPTTISTEISSVESSATPTMAVTTSSASTQFPTSSVEFMTPSAGLSATPSIAVVSAFPTQMSTSNSSATAVASVEYTYLGCYGDSAARAMSSRLGSVTSVRACYLLAIAGNFQYFGVQIGGRCWASNNYQKATQYNLCGPLCTGASQMCTCKQRCSATGENCGGVWANVLYVVGQATFETIQTDAPSLLPSVVPTFTPSVTITNAPTTVKYTYLGCYGDSAARAMDNMIGTVTSVQACHLLALAGKYQYFGMQYGVRCWASNNYQKATQYNLCGPSCTGASQLCTCKMPCSATGESCGGSWSNALYVVGQATSELIQTDVPTLAPVSESPTIYSTPFTYLGCYGDNAKRAMQMALGAVNSVAACYNRASDYKYKYFAIQYGGECWGSNSLSSATRYGQCGPGCTGGLQMCTCTRPCAIGDDCGGAFANVLYVANYFSTIPIIATTNPPVIAPTFAPSTAAPSAPSSIPTVVPSFYPSYTPTAPSFEPTLAPTPPPGSPTLTPSMAPTNAPVVTVLRANFTESTIRSAAFVGDEKGVFHAVDIATGKAIWTTFLGYYINPICGDMAGRYFSMTGSAVFNRTVNTIYVVGGNGSFNALSMKTGRTLWKINNFYDKTILHNYGALNEYNGIVYATLGGMCDMLLFKGGVFAVNTFTRSVQSYFSPSSNNPNLYNPLQYGGGVWGLGGVTIGDPSLSNGPPSIYFNTGNCLGNNRLKEDSLYCESIIKADLNLNLVGQIKPFKNPVYGDNDFGSSTTYFNSRSEPQTSGCTAPMISGLRKDSLLVIANADTMQVTQTFQIGQSNRAGGIQQAVWDSYENLLIITNPHQGEGQYAGIFPSGVLAFQLNATCGLNLKWNYVNYNAIASIMLVGPPGERVAIELGGYGGAMLDVKTGNPLRYYNLFGYAASPPAVANGTMIFSCADPGNNFLGQVLHGFECQGC